jgi:Pectate lyase superfamily protein
MPVEIFANQPSTTVTSGGTGTAPSSGTTQTWTVASSSEFPSASSTASQPTQFHIYDTAAGYTSELIAVTNVSGTSWTVTRGAEGTTPVTHLASFTVAQVVTAGGLAAFQAAASHAPDWYNVVTAYGASNNGANSSATTTAIQNAINACAAGGGGVVYFPVGTYLITPPSATVPALTVPSNVVLAGAGMGATILSKGGNGILIDFSGAGPFGEGVNPSQHQGLRDLAIYGNGYTGQVLRLYYVQEYYENNVYIYDNGDVAVDMAQCWDSRITNGLYLHGGSASESTISGGQACTHLIRNSAAPSTTLTTALSSTGGAITELYVTALTANLPAGIVQVWYTSGETTYTQNFTTTGASSTATIIPVTSATPNYSYPTSGTTVNGFGYSGDSSNAIFFQGCHWEDSISGAIWITTGPNAVNYDANYIYITNTKCELDSIGYNCPQIQVDAGMTDVHIDHLMFYAGGFNSGYSTAVPGIQFSPNVGYLSNVNLSNGSAATLTTGITCAPSQTVYLKNISEGWQTAPTSGNGIEVTGGTADIDGLLVFSNYTNAITTSGGGQVEIAGVPSSTSGHVLTSNGTGSLPSFQAVGAPSLQLAKCLAQSGRMNAMGYMGAVADYYTLSMAACTWTSETLFIARIDCAAVSAAVNGYVSLQWYAQNAGLANSYIGLYNSSGAQLGVTANLASQPNNTWIRVAVSGFTTTPSDGIVFAVYANGTQATFAGPGGLGFGFYDVPIPYSAYPPGVTTAGPADVAYGGSFLYPNPSGTTLPTTLPMTGWALTNILPVCAID